MAERSLLIAGPGTSFTVDTAERFAHEGFSIGLMGRNEQFLNDLAATLSSKDIQPQVTIVDFTNEQSINAATKQLSEQLPPWETVLYNVKQSHHGTVFDASVSEIQNDFDANVMGLLRLTRSVIKLWDRSENASVLLAGGGYKDSPDPNKLSLSVSKGAFHTLGLSMKEPLAERDIQISELVIDGFVAKDGPLFPADVADMFWKLHEDNISQVVAYPEVS